MKKQSLNLYKCFYSDNVLIKLESTQTIGEVVTLHIGEVLGKKKNRLN